MTSLFSTHQLYIERNGRKIVANLNLSINAGECWGIIGPNGAGKSTLLHTLAGLSAATSGHINYQHQRLTTLSQKEIATKIAVMFQSTGNLLPQTVFEYVASSRFPHLKYFDRAENDRHIIQSALATVELLDQQHRMLHELSGGEQCRAAIAAVLCQTPDIYLLDEPTNHLDLRHQFRILQYFKQHCLQDQKCVLMCLHDINLAQTFCTHILMLHHNGDMQYGAVSDILTEDNLSRLFNVRIKLFGNVVGEIL